MKSFISEEKMFTSRHWHSSWPPYTGSIRLCVRLAFFCMGRDMEMSCDEHVLVEMGSGIKKEYSLSLLSFASNRRLHPAGPLSFGEKDAKSRVKISLVSVSQAYGLPVGGTLMILVIAAVCLTNGTGGAGWSEGQTKQK